MLCTCALLICEAHIQFGGRGRCSRSWIIFAVGGRSHKIIAQWNFNRKFECKFHWFVVCLSPNDDRTRNVASKLVIGNLSWLVLANRKQQLCHTSLKIVLGNYVRHPGQQQNTTAQKMLQEKFRFTTQECLNKVNWRSNLANEHKHVNFMSVRALLRWDVFVLASLKN